MKMFGLEILVDTSWKKDFSCWEKATLATTQPTERFEPAYSQCHCRLSIEHQDEDVSVQTVIINPVVKVLRDINARRVDEDYVVAQKTALRSGPENVHFRTFRKLFLTQSVRQLLYRLKTDEQIIPVTSSEPELQLLTDTLHLSTDPSFIRYPSDSSVPST
jgi:hypothetical protein